jgi:hypothetical protein
MANRSQGIDVIRDRGAVRTSEMGSSSRRRIARRCRGNGSQEAIDGRVVRAVLKASLKLSDNDRGSNFDTDRVTSMCPCRRRPAEARQAFGQHRMKCVGTLSRGDMQ